jgi:hypothetical protein
MAREHLSAATSTSMAAEGAQAARKNTPRRHAAVAATWQPFAKVESMPEARLPTRVQERSKWCWVIRDAVHRRRRLWPPGDELSQCHGHCRSRCSAGAQGVSATRPFMHACWPSSLERGPPWLQITSINVDYVTGRSNLEHHRLSHPLPAHVDGLRQPAGAASLAHTVLRCVAASLPSPLRASALSDLSLHPTTPAAVSGSNMHRPCHGDAVSSRSLQPGALCRVDCLAANFCYSSATGALLDAVVRVQAPTRETTNLASRTTLSSRDARARPASTCAGGNHAVHCCARTAPLDIGLQLH